MARSTVVDEVTDRIAFQIASGRLEAGESLPSIRRLAAEHGINPSTVQLVLGRLRTAGFVEARHGVGVVVRDIQLYGGIETWRYLFRFSRRLPDLTVATVRDILETLRLFYDASLTKIAADPAAYDATPARRALGRLELLTGDGTVPAADVHKGVLQILRSSRAAVGGGVTLGVLNSLGAMLSEIPEVLDALYADPAEHVWWWGQVLESWETGDLERGRQTLALLDDWHVQALQRLRARLTADPS
ncbi:MULTISPECIES: GntR family transcriptional regulator [Actinomadura]|uniref:GntR family transcriptional regulator n=1 Tax=Actinomadura yumaensis TaxID=111807 RepID=A0ABW2CW41_9ACTN|nr:GntR family transcriptional regulator [Actinomadura sp. J1-007]MWK40571.1 GntR family transcriptional regulator [Actinomadura sp. J1-007]